MPVPVLTFSWRKKSASDDTQAMPLPTDVQDVLMSEDPSYHVRVPAQPHSQGPYFPPQSDAGSECSSSSSSSTNAGSHGCAYLRTISSQLDSFATTSGEYLEAIFTHREIFSAYPGAHPQCARGFSDIAYAMEQRAWRADRDADIEAVNAFRHEAWMIAAYMQ